MKGEGHLIRNERGKVRQEKACFCFLGKEPQTSENDQKRRLFSVRTEHKGDFGTKARKLL